LVVEPAQYYIALFVILILGRLDCRCEESFDKLRIGSDEAIQRPWIAAPLVAGRGIKPAGGNKKLFPDFLKNNFCTPSKRS